MSEYQTFREKGSSLSNITSIDPEKPSVVAKESLVELGIQVVVDTVEEHMEQEADILTGAAKGKHCDERLGNRHGYTSGHMVFNGQKIPISRPRIRALDGKEMSLSTYLWAQNPDSLNLNAVTLALSGVSTRKHETVVKTIAPVPEGMDTLGVSASAVSRRFVSMAQQKVVEINSRFLGDERYLVLYVDGVQESGHHVLVAMGLDAHGQKRILGIYEGSSENTAVVGALLDGLIARGFNTNRGLLAVIDGSKALQAAIEKTFSSKVQIQRCQVHKKRNVMDKLPDNKAKQVGQQMANAYNAENFTLAKASLATLATRLDFEGYNAAAASLREGLELTLTCIKLDIGADLRRTVSNTNPIESAFSTYEANAKRVKRWRNGQQVLNWMATGLLAAEAFFATVDSREDLKKLGNILEHHTRAFDVSHSAS